MNKYLTLLLILIIAPLLGGIYGILHDQITYSISTEYYTKFKFVQFGFEHWGLGENIGTVGDPEIKLTNPRFGAAIVGTLSTWWVGLIIGIILGLTGLLQKNRTAIFKTTMKALILTTSIALVTGLVGLVFGKVFLAANASSFNIPANVSDSDAFVMVGSMHNFSYLGGLIGLLFGVRYIVKQHRKSLVNTVDLSGN